MIRRLLLLSLILLAALGFLKWNAERLQAQSATNGRLQIHGDLELRSSDSVLSWQAIRVQAICDTGNGTMLYVVRNYNEHRIETKLLPSGCQKPKAER